MLFVSFICVLLCLLIMRCYSLVRRAPDFIIGGAVNPQLNRWFVVPRNAFGNIYLHQILRSDDDTALHDHPWFNISIVLQGFYWEYVAGEYRPKLRRAGSIVFRRATVAHRLELGDTNTPCWTLFITGPRIREWGFHCPKGWRPWQEFVDARDIGAVGRGCGE
ncbi:MAG: hypothetical protein Q7S99_03150 [Parvibaculum sp.]|nr:hypothetical protein [Parvibaculum sp.]